MQNITLLMSPSIEGSLKFGWEKTKQYFLPLLMVVFVIAVANIPVDNSLINFKKVEDDPFQMEVVPFTFYKLFSLAYWLLLLPVFEYGADYMFLQAIRDQKISFNDLVRGFQNYLNVVLAHLLSTALIGIAFVALIIPGIIVACRLAFVSYLVMDKNLDPVQAVETSWKMTKGHGWKIFGLALTSILIILIGLVCLIVGIFPAMIWIKAAFASMYESLLIEQTETQSNDQGFLIN